MSSPVLLLILLAILFFSFYGKRTFLGFWGSLFFMVLVTVVLFPVFSVLSFLPGAAIILLMGWMKKTVCREKKEKSDN